jgi:hypothetical protein
MRARHIVCIGTAAAQFDVFSYFDKPYNCLGDVDICHFQQDLEHSRRRCHCHPHALWNRFCH